ncbi:hypothetical protein BBM1128_10620 [Bifidobacterium breve MCC 1128]|uniref:Uncharacterized protein n=1 Tax=Bifidobacterium breve MCC 1128 TaxID=1365965 RepID=A0A0L7ATT2_BIFBR|nr:hypothetical protein BBM1128_10620 [Bifidobacterium breve MCC 1128]
MSDGAMTSIAAADRMRLMIYRIMLFVESFFRCGLQRLIPCGASRSISIRIIFTKMSNKDSGSQHDCHS